jgi:hypothetical protein
MKLIHVKSDKRLSDFAADLLPAIGIVSFSMHESSNYPPDFVYMLGKGNGMKCTICAEDALEYAGFQYWLALSADRLAEENAALSLVEGVLAAKGYEFALEG